MSWVNGQGDINRSNRPVRTRMPGGMGGVRSCLIAPYPDDSRQDSMRLTLVPGDKTLLPKLSVLVRVNIEFLHFFPQVFGADAQRGGGVAIVPMALFQ